MKQRQLKMAKNTRKVLFLDFDGVMVTDRYQAQLTASDSPLRDSFGAKFDPVCVQFLRQIIDRTGADIVVTSSWKIKLESEGIRQMWRDRDLPGRVIGVTPDIDPINRGNEIEAWLDMCGEYCRYAIIDDSPFADFFNKEQLQFLFRVDERTGIDEETMLQVVRHLNSSTFKNAGDGYPPEWIKTRRISQRVEILYPFKHPMEEMKRLVGCEDIKRRLIEFKMLAEYNRACERQSPEFPVMQIFLHSIFYGNPGTGKSTVCRLYGSLLKEAGMLSKGHVVVADRKIFTGDCFGDTEDILRELIKYSEGGVLMFDEAYLLEGTHPNDPNKMVLPMLLSELADTKKKDSAVVLCGYKDKLDRMLEQNPGLYSRFVNRFEFKDYSIDELTEIGVRYLKSFGHNFTFDGLASFREELSAAMSCSSKSSWANARSVRGMVEHIYILRAKRFGKDGRLDREITSEDICSIPYEHSRKIGFQR